MIHRFFTNLLKGEAPMWFLALLTFAGMMAIVFFIDQIVGWLVRTFL